MLSPHGERARRILNLKQACATPRSLAESGRVWIKLQVSVCLSQSKPLALPASEIHSAGNAISQPSASET